MSDSLHLQGTTLVSKGNATVGSCCQDCWSFGEGGGSGSQQCDVWVFDPRSGGCALKSSTPAARSQIVAAGRNSTSAFISGPYSSPVHDGFFVLRSIVCQILGSFRAAASQLYMKPLIKLVTLAIVDAMAEVSMAAHVQGLNYT